MAKFADKIEILKEKELLAITNPEVLRLKTIEEKGWVSYPNVKNLTPFTHINLDLIWSEPGASIIDIRKDSPTGKRIAIKKVVNEGTGKQSITLPISSLNDKENLIICIEGCDEGRLAIDSFFFSKK